MDIEFIKQELEKWESFCEVYKPGETNTVYERGDLISFLTSLKDKCEEPNHLCSDFDYGKQEGQIELLNQLINSLK